MNQFFFFLQIGGWALFFKMSLIFGKISALCPCKLCPHSKKKRKKKSVTACSTVHFGLRYLILPLLIARRFAVRAYHRRAGVWSLNRSKSFDSQYSNERCVTKLHNCDCTSRGQLGLALVRLGLGFDLCHGANEGKT